MDRTERNSKGDKGTAWQMIDGTEMQKRTKLNQRRWVYEGESDMEGRRGGEEGKPE